MDPYMKGILTGKKTLCTAEQNYQVKNMHSSGFLPEKRPVGCGKLLLE